MKSQVVSAIYTVCMMTLLATSVVQGTFFPGLPSRTLTDEGVAMAINTPRNVDQGFPKYCKRGTHARNRGNDVVKQQLDRRRSGKKERKKDRSKKKDKRKKRQKRGWEFTYRTPSQVVWMPSPVIWATMRSLWAAIEILLSSSITASALHKAIWASPFVVRYILKMKWTKFFDE